MADIIKQLEDGLEEFSISATPDGLLKMQEFCIVYGLQPDDVVTNWIAFAASTNDITNEPTLDLLLQFEKEKLMKMNRGPKKGKNTPSSKVPIPKIYDATTIDHLDDIDMLGECTPKAKKGSLRTAFSPSSFSPLQSGTPSAKYSSRKTSGDIVFTFGNLENISWEIKSQPYLKIAYYQEENALKERYTYMFETVHSLKNSLNSIITNLALNYQDTHNIAEWSPVHLPSMEPISVVGRICSDDGNKLSVNSILLEGSEESSSGNTVSLDVSQLETFSLFPGQIISGTGINYMGKKFTLKDLYKPKSPPFPFVQKLHCLEDGLSVIIATGPFSTTDNLNYDPLKDLLKYVENHKPHVLILIGPFIDVKHEEIQNGRLSETYESMFQELITMCMNTLDENISVILVSSLRDMHHDSIYPTPPFDNTFPFKNLFLASDPCILNINGVVLGITSADILLHLGKEEIHKSSNPSDRLGRLCKHLLDQSNFYPLYPPSEEVNIDYFHHNKYSSISVTPHILIVPSDLRYFIKNVDGCCCVNPERLTKGCTGGTFARLRIKPLELKTGVSIADSIYGEIIKI